MVLAFYLSRFLANLWMFNLFTGKLTFTLHSFIDFDLMSIFQFGKNSEVINIRRKI